MTIGTPLWDDFVKKLKEVKTTVEDMGFMPEDFPGESELKSMTAQQKGFLVQHSIVNALREQKGWPNTSHLEPTKRRRFFPREFRQKEDSNVRGKENP